MAELQGMFCPFLHSRKADKKGEEPKMPAMRRRKEGSMTKPPPDACRCDASPWPHIHVTGGMTFKPPVTPELARAYAWREQARTDHDAAKAALVKSIFGNDQ